MGFQDRQYYREQQSFNPVSLDRHSIVAILLMINVAIFLIDSFTPRVPVALETSTRLETETETETEADAPAERMVVDPAGGLQTLAYYLGVRYEHPWHLWSYLTYGFAHASLATETSFWHLLGNMLTLFFLGRAVEEALGRTEFLKFYLISIVICGVGFTLFRHLMGWQFSSLVGASGGVSAVTALFIFMFPQVTLYVFGVLPLPAWVLGVILLGHNLIIAVSPSSNTAWEAHLLGFAFGAAYFYGKWSFSRMPLPALAGWGAAGPSLKLHDPDQVDAQLQAEADQILKKISEQGEASLTRRERKKLTLYSQQLRDRRR